MLRPKRWGKKSRVGGYKLGRVGLPETQHFFLGLMQGHTRLNFERNLAVIDISLLYKFGEDQKKMETLSCKQAEL